MENLLALHLSPPSSVADLPKVLEELQAKKASLSININAKLRKFSTKERFEDISIGNRMMSSAIWNK